jgi:hypothetical protein
MQNVLYEFQINTGQARGTAMRLDEIEQAVAAAQKRVDTLKASADREKKRAKEIKARTEKTEDILRRRDAGRSGQAAQKIMVLPPSVRTALDS